MTPTIGAECQRGDDTASGQIQVKWKQITSPQNGGADVQNYSVYWDDGNGGDITTWPTQPIATVAAGSNPLSHTASGLKLMGSYQFAITANNVHGSGPKGKICMIGAK